MENVDILAVGAHPDDVELACSGTLLKHLSMGYTVGLLDLTLGELGTRGSAILRTKEALESAQRMGASFRTQLNLGDGFFEVEESRLRAVIQVIRACQPAILFANAPHDRHPDHGRSAELVRRAAFLSGLRRIETVGSDGSPQEAWRPKAVYHYIQDERLEPDVVVDISAFIKEKLALIKTFRSQFYDPDSPEPDSPISGKDFLDFILARAQDLGRPAGYAFAEGWITNRYPGVQDLMQID
ncbi:MAG: bacillithiol biosynthesis deacetylase BshB1 [Saprospiraceae bacterium]|nr:bacillithiol biosynthesis deacetylase BshB1 [Saprospiraceae bacterium]